MGNREWEMGNNKAIQAASVLTGVDNIVLCEAANNMEWRQAA